MARAGTASRTAKRTKPARPEANAPDWRIRTLAVLAFLLVLRLAWNAANLVPVHFDEAQYWAYGRELDWGYYSKPPLVGAAIRLTTGFAGETLFGLRLAAPLAHTLIAWLIFAAARRLFDARTGFWAATGYAIAPGVGVSSMIVSTDPVMMVFWALGLYAMTRVEPGKLFWWSVIGLAIGLGMLAKYTMIAFAGGLIGWALFVAPETRKGKPAARKTGPGGRDLKGLSAALAVALAVFAPNLIWNAQNGFVTVAHVAGDANPGGPVFDPVGLAEFLGAQFGVIGAVFFAAIAIALLHRRDAKPARAMRLLVWQTAPLLGAIAALAFVTRAQPNWAAPAYVAGSIMAARWLLTTGRERWMVWGQFALSAAATAAVCALAVLHASGQDFPRATDPFKKMRLGEPFCQRALASMSEEGAELLLSNDRRRLSECMFLGGLTWDEIAVWNPGLAPRNHHELIATLYPGDERVMLLAVLGDGAAIARRFDEAREIDAGSFPTHADRDIAYSLWTVRGFRNY